jgi:hypothetical protein
VSESMVWTISIIAGCVIGILLWLLVVGGYAFNQIVLLLTDIRDELKKGRSGCS